MIYVFDSSTLIHLFRNFYLSRFPSLWDKFDQAVKVESITSVREVWNEIKDYEDRLAAWAKTMSPASTAAVAGHCEFSVWIPRRMEALSMRSS